MKLVKKKTKEPIEPSKQELFLKDLLKEMEENPYHVKVISEYEYSFGYSSCLIRLYFHDYNKSSGTVYLRVDDYEISYAEFSQIGSHLIQYTTEELKYQFAEIDKNIDYPNRGEYMEAIKTELCNRLKNKHTK